jgi:hypothetical protein
METAVAPRRPDHYPLRPWPVPYGQLSAASTQASASSLHQRAVSNTRGCRQRLASFTLPSASANLTTRVAIFRQKNYSAEYGTRRNRRQFCRNSASFAEEKNLWIPFRTISLKRKTLGIPFRTISWKRKTLGILFRTIFGWEKPRNSVPNHFWKRKNFGIPFRIIFGREKTWKKTTFVSCFVKLHYFAEFRSVLFRSEIRNGLFRSTRNHTEWAL